MSREFPEFSRIKHWTQSCSPYTSRTGYQTHTALPQQRINELCRLDYLSSQEALTMVSSEVGLRSPMPELWSFDFEGRFPSAFESTEQWMVIVLYHRAIFQVYLGNWSLRNSSFYLLLNGIVDLLEILLRRFKIRNACDQHSILVSDEKWGWRRC